MILKNLLAILLFIPSIGCCVAPKRVDMTYDWGTISYSPPKGGEKLLN